MRLKVLFSDEDFDRGEVVDAALGTLPDGRIMVRANGSSGGEHRFYYKSIDGFIEDWADPYEEPKEYWFVSDNGYICSCIDDGDSWDEHRKEVGNYFSSREEAEKAVEKLKAVKRLRDKGFEFDVIPALGHCDDKKFDISIIATMPAKWWCNDKVVDDIHYVFGGEE